MRRFMVLDSVIVIQEDEIGGACGTYGGLGKCIQDLVGRLQGKRPLGRPGCGWEDDTENNLREIIRKGPHLSQDRAKLVGVL
jgi:hypothetical protein